MTEDEIRHLIATELRAPRLAVTQQYLDIHQVEYQAGAPIIARIAPPDATGIIRAYLPVADEKFYLVVYLDAKAGHVCGVSTEAWHRVSLRATSETMSATEMVALTTLTPTTQWSKGDLRPNGRNAYSFSALSFLPNPEPDTFENKIEKLLDFLEQDAVGIQRIVQATDCGIDVALDMHNGNGMLGGAFLAARTVQRMAGLGVSIEFDLYAAGKPFRD